MKTYDELEEMLKNNGLIVSYMELSACPGLKGSHEELDFSFSIDTNTLWFNDDNPHWYCEKVRLYSNDKKIYSGCWLEEDDVKECLKIVKLLHFKG